MGTQPVGGPSPTASVPAPDLPARVASRRALLLGALSLAMAAFLLYVRTGDFEFVGIDDDSYIVQNPAVAEGLTTEGFQWALTAEHSSNWHPLTWLSHMLDIELFGMDGGPPHLVNAALHALATALLFLALCALTRRIGPNLVVAGLFAVHPTHVESVAWISERKDVLSGVFWMLTLLAWAFYARRPSAGRYLSVLIALALGLLSKPMLVTLPFVLLLLDVWPLPRWRPMEGKTAWRLVLEKVPLFVLVGISSVITVHAQAASGSTRSLDAMSPTVRVANACASYVAYLGDTLWPTGLAAFYPHPAVVQPQELGGLWITGGIGAVVLVAVSFLAWRAFARAPYILVGWLWFLGTLVPVIGLMQVGNQTRADRYLYLPSIGLFLAAVYAIAALPKLAPHRRPLTLVAAVVLAGYAATAWIQIGTWRDTETLCTHAIEVTENNYLAHSTLGTALYARGDFEGARGQFVTALRIRPDHLGSLNNLGITLLRLRQPEAGLRILREAVRIDPDHADSRANLGRTLLERSELEEAVVELRAAVRLAPHRPEPALNLGLAHLALGELSEARVAFEATLHLAPGNAVAHANLGGIAVAQEDWTRAEAHLTAALRINANLPAPHYSLGLVALHRGNVARARERFQRVLTIAPDHAGARAQLQALGRQ